MKMLIITWDKLPFVKALIVKMTICDNTIEFSLTLLRDLLSFENCRGGGAKGILGGGIAPLWLRPCSILYRK